MSSAIAAVDNLNMPLFLTTDMRNPLPLFGNSYYGEPWDMFKERAFIHSLSQRVDYNGYVYQRNGSQDDKVVKVRSAVTYILSCRHLYPGLYEERVRHAANFKSEYKLSTETIADTRFSAMGSGILNLSFID